MKPWILLVSSLLAADSLAADALPSWKEGAAKKSITDFVAKVATQGSADFVPHGWTVVSMKDDWKTVFPPVTP